MADKMSSFEMTKDHIALMQRMWVNWNDDAYEGAPEIDLKRPYGNSDVIQDVAEIVAGYPEPFSWEGRDEYIDFDRDGDIKRVRTIDGRELTSKDLQRLHTEMEFALQIALSTLSFVPGTYVRDWPRNNWRLINTTPSGN